ncbi:hypothetical protein T01_11443 [Trichinella spiralis]|uniref:Uncharacterized protein n=1 Tax=Trichinella spiralis TaxID=6334 RepID=A0A0V1B303_TRISP|nr:hypothetical protein T01_11443 [Trichinella spiralis]
MQEEAKNWLCRCNLPFCVVICSIVLSPNPDRLQPNLTASFFPISKPDLLSISTVVGAISGSLQHYSFMVKLSVALLENYHFICAG